MIPSIEEIIGNLLAGDISQTQAIEWLHQHIASAYAKEDKSVLRDMFAGQAMQAYLNAIVVSFMNDKCKKDGAEPSVVSTVAYQIADGMMAARNKS